MLLFVKNTNILVYNFSLGYIIKMFINSLIYSLMIFIFYRFLKMIYYLKEFVIIVLLLCLYGMSYMNAAVMQIENLEICLNFLHLNKICAR